MVPKPLFPELLLLLHPANRPAASKLMKAKVMDFFMMANPLEATRRPSEQVGIRLEVP